MKHLALKSLCLALCLGTFPAMAADTSVSAPVIGQPAPEFKTTDTQGKPFSLKDMNGKTVVLEWTNHECPYVRKHYDSGNMQSLQKMATGNGVEWISIISSAPGKEGHVTATQANEIAAKENAVPSRIILDEKGAIGHKYGAKTTPHMFIIDKAGLLVYAGAIDDKPNTDKNDIPGAKNYVRDALTSLHEGKPVADSQTNPYGCSVKY